MLPATEALFIQRFVIKGRRERLLFELSADKRGHGLGRFAHGAVKILIAGCMHPYKLIDVEKLYADMLALGCAKDGAHIICTSWEADNCMPLFEALRQAVYGGTLFVVAKGATAAYFEGEPDYASDKYLIY